MTTFLRTFLINVIWFLELSIVARILISWVQTGHHSRIQDFFNQITEPLLGPVRNILPRTGMFDLSPLVVLLILSALEQALRRGTFF